VHVVRTSKRIVVRHLEAVVSGEIDAVAFSTPAVVTADRVAHDHGPPGEPPLFRVLEVLSGAARRATSGSGLDVLHQLAEVEASRISYDFSRSCRHPLDALLPVVVWPWCTNERKATARSLHGTHS